MAKRRFNRLYDRHTGGAVIAIKSDLLFKRAIERLLEEGYANSAEAIYECVYAKMNDLGAQQSYPTLEGWKENRSKEEMEMERALTNLNALKANLGVMRAQR